MDTQLTGAQWKSKSSKKYLEVIGKIKNYNRPSKFMLEVEANLPPTNNVRGKIFELAFCEILKRENITPFYYQVRFAPRPIIDFDILLYQSPNRPWSFSLKTTLRERWKQSYLEAVILKNTYPAAKSYLVTLDESEGQRRQQSIENQEMPELNQCILANTDELDFLVNELQKQQFNPITAVRLFNGSEFF